MTPEQWELVTENMGLVHKQITRFLRLYPEMATYQERLDDAGFDSLVKAAKSYDPTKLFANKTTGKMASAKFSTYVWPTIWHDLQKVRVDLHRGKIHQVLSDLPVFDGENDWLQEKYLSTEIDQDESLDLSESKALLKRLLTSLETKQRIIMREYYLEGMLLRELAEKHGRTKQAVQQTAVKALEYIRSVCRAKGITWSGKAAPVPRGNCTAVCCVACGKIKDRKSMKKTKAGLVCLKSKCEREAMTA